MPTVSYGITNTNDDVYSYLYNGNAAIELDFVQSQSSTVGEVCHAGFRFLGVAVPKGATITSATLTLKVSVTQGTTFGKIKGVNVDNAAAWSTTNPPHNAPQTSQSVDVVNTDAAYDVSGIVQALVNRTGWASGNNLAFVADPTGGNGRVMWTDYWGSTANSAKLSITYHIAGSASIAVPASSPYAVGSYSTTYTTARAGSGVVSGPGLWVGQNKNGTLFELSETFLHFPASGVPVGSILRKMEIRFTAQEAYGSTTINTVILPDEVGSGWIPGADLASFATMFSVGTLAVPSTGSYVVDIPTQSEPIGTSLPAYRFVLASVAMLAGTAPTADDTVLLTNVSLYIEYDPPAEITLNSTVVPPSKFLNGVPVNTPVGTVIGEVSGWTYGSTLALLPSADSFLVLEGTQIKLSGPITRPVNANIYLDFKETLAGATNSPLSVYPTVGVRAERGMEFVGSKAGTTTPSLPPHQAGDLLVCFMFRDGVATAPATPTGWTSASTVAGSVCAYRLVYKIATSSSEGVGAASTATSCVTSCYRPAAGYTLSMGATARITGSSLTVTYQALTLQTNTGTSFVGAASAHRSVNTAIETPPTGMILRYNDLDATDEAAMFDTDGGVTSWTSKTVTPGGTTSGWISVVYELKAAYTPPAAPYNPVFQSFMIH